MRIDFYILKIKKNEELSFIYKLTEKIYNEGQKTFLHTTSSKIKELNDALWTIRDTGFIPHQIYNKNLINEAPVLIGSPDNYQSNGEILINMTKVQATYLIDHPGVKIRLAGNTDERGSREYNIALGWRRAKAVASILEQNGISPSQMVLISYGEERPVAFCHQEKCYKLNRRVNLTYLSGTK